MVQRLWPRVAVILAAVLTLSLAGPQESLAAPGRDPLPLSWLWSWWGLPAGWTSPPAPPGPAQEWAGGAARPVPAAATRATRGAGRPRTKGAGELDAYTPHKVPAPGAVTTGRQPDGRSFDPAKSTRLPADSTADSDVFQNPDGSFTRRVYSGPHNFKAPDGTWTPIDTSLAKQTDGRWHEHANAWSVDFAPSADDTALASVRVDSSHAIVYGLRGAGPVAPSVSGSTVRYPGVFAGTDLELTTTATGVEESLVLHSAKVPTSWVFPLRLQGLTPRLGSDGSVSFVDSAGTVRAVVPPGSMTDARPGRPATSQAVAYSLTTVNGLPALALSVDSVWLSDPARVFPVRVDPPVNIPASSSTFADSVRPGDNSASPLLDVGTDGTETANSFLQFSSFGTTFHNASLTGVSLNLFDVYASSCNAAAFSVYPVTQVWTPPGVTSYPGPSFSSTAIGTLTQAPGAACTNAAQDPDTGTPMSVTLDSTTFTSWAHGGDNFGLAVTASQTDPSAWKEFASSSSGHQPYLSVTYQGNLPPVIDGQSPANNSTVWTLQPTLVSGAHDPDAGPQGLTYFFALYDSTNPNTPIATRPFSSSPVWPLGTNLLSVGRSYLWYSQAFDGAAYSATEVYSFRVEAQQPPITSHLSQNSDKGLDPSIGNYTTSATDATVLTAGPPLQIQRDYNSKDPRVTGAFGAAWSSVLDSKVTERKDPQSSLVSVVMTYPDGQEVAFGKASDGSFKAPTGRYANVAAVTNPTGYTLTDKNQTVYAFTQPLNPGCAAQTCQYGITSITDGNGRAITFGYDAGGQLVSMTSGVSKRVLHIGWSTPAGATVRHVSTVSTDPATTGDSTTIQTWTYTYNGDQLTTVCPPTSSTACTTYAYQSAQEYPNTVLDLGPRSYWRFGESSGTLAGSQVLANNGADTATYHNVNLGKPGPFPGSTAAEFDVPDTENSYVDLTQNGVVSKELFNDSMPMTVSMWFNSTDVEAPLLSYSQESISKGSTTAGYVPALYIGLSGKLHAEFWVPGAVTTITTPNPVNDGQWHHVVLSYDTTNSGLQKLYLDGSLVGSMPGTVTVAGAPYEYVGTAFLGGAWPDEEWQNQTPQAAWYQGSISDLAYYTTSLDAAAVTTLYNAGHNPGQLLSGFTKPSGNVGAAVTYDPVSGRVATFTDTNGSMWKLGQPTVAGSSQVFVNSVLGASPLAYFRLGDATGPTAADVVHGGDSTYSGVTLGIAASPFADGTSAASFDPTKPSYVALPTISTSTTPLLDGKGSMSVAMWFKTNAAASPLLSYNQNPISAGTTTAGYVPALYVGSSGRLYAKLWAANSGTMISTSNPVNDGSWHYVVLAYDVGSGVQTLYLDGSPVGTATGTVDASGMPNQYVGAAFLGGAWPDEPWLNQAGHAAYFNGLISDVSVYHSVLSQAAVQAQVAASKTANNLITDGGATPVESVTMTDPRGKTLTYAYDAVMGGRLLSRTDALGNTTRYGYDTSGFLYTTVDPLGNVVTTGHDVRGNVVSRTSCQDQAVNACSTSYYTFYPDDTTANPAPNPSNDVMLTSSDARSSSASDTTYRTTYAYDGKGNRIGTTTPAGNGCPTGCTSSTHFTDGTTGTPPGLPDRTVTAGGATQTTSYLANGDIGSVTDADGLVTSYTYDNLGRPLTKAVSCANCTWWNGTTTLTTTMTFDKLNRLQVEVDPPVTNRVTGAVHQRRNTTTYDADGNVTAQKVEDLSGGDAARTVKATFNNHDQQVTSTDPAGNTTTYGYDEYGNKSTVVDASGTETDYLYDADSRELSATLKGYTGDPVNPSPAKDTTMESRTYNAAGRLTSVTDAIGWTTSYGYTDDGLIATVTRSDLAKGLNYVQESDTYDAAGNLTMQLTNGGATTTTRTVDANNRTTSATVDPGGVNRTTTYAYSPDDMVLSTTVTGASGSATVLATYDPMGRPLSRTVNNDTTSHPAGWWKLNEAGGSFAADSSGAGQTGALTGGVTWSNGSASFDSTKNGAITTGGPVLNTSQSFTVSAWVNIPDTKGYYTAVGQDGAQQSGFYLQYNLALNRWAFARQTADVANPSTVSAASSAAPTLNTWTHLVGVFDATNGAMTLYVNGAAQGTATDTTPFNAPGGLTVGRAKANGALTNYFNGSISNVQVYQRALSASEVATLHTNGQTGGAVGTSQLTTTWTLDKRGLPLSATDPNGNTTQYLYDEANQLVQTTAPTVSAESNGQAAVQTHPSTGVGFDTFGEKTETRDGNGDVTTTAYDADGRPVSVALPPYTPPGGTAITAVARKTYNGLNQVATSTDPLGHQTSYLYDQVGNVAKVTAPNGGVTHYTYDLVGDELTATDANGVTTEATYDYLGRKVTSTQDVRQASDAPYTTAYAYATGGGWLSSVTTPSGVPTSYTYDNVGETVSVTDAASNTTSYAYDYAGRTTRTTFPDGTAATATFDTAGRQIGAARLAASGTVLASTTTGYDNNGNPTSTTDALGHTTSFGFDASNKLIAENQPISTTTTINTSFGYDQAGKRTRFTDGRSNSFITTYNSWNLPESTIEPSTPQFPNAVDRTFTTAYDADGRVATQTSPGNVAVTDTYDSVGDLTGQTGTGADAATTARTFGYDAGGRLTSASAPGGTDTFTLDDRGLLLAASGPSGSSSFAYNKDGLMTSRTDASGASSYTYDTDDRLKTITDGSTGTVATVSYNGMSQPSQVTYGSGADQRAFGYDSLHRLTSDTLSTSSGSKIAWITYGYDANGNETSKSTTGFAGASSNAYSYDWANRLLSWNNGTATSTYAYDLSGNRTQAGTQTFTYNARNELISGAGSTYTYTARGTLASVTTGSSTVTTKNDAFGQAITQGTQTYAYDALGRVVTDKTSGGSTRTFSYSGAGNTLAGDGTSTYSRDPGGGLIGIKTGTTGVLAWIDAHTDVVGDFTKTGTSLAGSRTYGPLGTVVANANLAGNLGYQSQFTEPSSGRVDMGARWYNPATGQFDNRDTVSNSPVPGSVNADQYAYANDNPLTNVDPDGHRSFEQDDSGQVFFAVASTNGGHDVAWGTSHLHWRGPAPKFQRPSSHNWHHNTNTWGSYHQQRPSNVTVQSSAVCGGADWRCSVDVQNQVQDTANKLAQQHSEALGAAAHCTSQACYEQAMANADWLDNGDGTYTTTDGYNLVTYTDTKRVQQIAAQKDAAAKKAQCEKSFWCKAKTWVENHAELVGEIAGAVAGVIVGAACTIGSWGIGTAGCVVVGALVAGAVSGLVTHSIEVASGQAEGGVMGFLSATVEGAGNSLKSLVMTPVDAIKNAGAVVSDLRRGDWKGAGLATAGLALDVATVVGVGGGVASDVKAGVAAFRSGTADLASGTADGAAADSALAEDSGPVGCRNSFDPATPVLMGDGSTRPIKDIKIGDRVTATDPQTGKTSVEPVTQLHRNLDTDLTDLTLSDRPIDTLRALFAPGTAALQGHAAILHTTAHHPFWDTTIHRWVPAGDLLPGHELVGPDGAVQFVAAVDNYVGAEYMRNLTVADVHTYYVVAGNTPVLVHNDGGLTPDEQAMADQANAIYRSGDFDRIRAAYSGGYSETINVNGYHVQYEPNLPASGFSIRPNADGDPVGMVLGPEAFTSETELQRTIHHEMFRITQDYIGRDGYSAAVGNAETEDAFNFAQRAVKGC